MKKLVFFAMLTASVWSFGQDSQEVYCEIVGRSTLSLTGKIKIDVDFGQENKVFEGFNNDVLKDPVTGKPRKFNSMIDALNFMSADGWRLVNAYDVSSGESTVYHYVMRKEMKREE